jgi:nitrate/TMAO reductase-like tetraheme cytochrome c subunit
LKILGRWSRRLGLAALVAVVIIIGGFATLDPYLRSTRFCLSCHEVKPFGDSLKTSKHYEKGVKECGECHIGPGILGAIKAKFLGFRDLVAHVRQTYKVHPIAIEPWNLAIVNQRCRECHTLDHTKDPAHMKYTATYRVSLDEKKIRALLCTDCHPGIIHKPEKQKQLREYAKTRESPGETYDMWACLPCHRVVNPLLVKDWGKGAHAREGYLCNTCHGLDHNEINTRKAAVSAGTCAPCHKEEYKTFLEGKHAKAAVSAKENARYHVLTVDMQQKGCDACHGIGRDNAWDKSTGKCDSCHTRHTLSVAEAREPGACGTCHMGPDHPQIEMYQTSKHGVVYQQSKGSTDRGPTCQFCHGLLEPKNHNVSLGVAHGLSGQTLEADVFKQRRAFMVGQCSKCHSAWYAKRNLRAADNILAQSTEMLTQAQRTLEDLYKGGFLDDALKNCKPNPVTGKVFEIGPNMLYSNEQPFIMNEFFKLKKYYYVKTWKGAYHSNPDYAHWYGWAEFNLSFNAIMDEARKMRAAKGAR